MIHKSGAFQVSSYRYSFWADESHGLPSEHVTESQFFTELLRLIHLNWSFEFIYGDYTRFNWQHARVSWFHWDSRHSFHCSAGSPAQPSCLPACLAFDRRSSCRVKIPAVGDYFNPPSASWGWVPSEQSSILLSRFSLPSGA